MDAITTPFHSLKNALPKKKTMKNHCFAMSVIGTSRTSGCLAGSSMSTLKNAAS